MEFYRDIEEKLAAYKAVSYVLLMFLIIILIVFVLIGQKGNNLQKQIDWYESYYQNIKGATSLRYDKNTHTIAVTKEMIPYNIMSFDSGRVWYVVHYQGDSLIIEGDVRTIHP